MILGNSRVRIQIICVEGIGSVGKRIYFKNSDLINDMKLSSMSTFSKKHVVKMENGDNYLRIYVIMESGRIIPSALRGRPAFSDD